MTRATKLMQTGQMWPAGRLLNTPGIVYWRLGLQWLVNIIDNVDNKKLSTNIFVVE